LAQSLGFVAVGFSPAEPPPFLDFYYTWLARGCHADMDWLLRRAGLRADPRRLLKSCRTVISLAYPYTNRQSATPEGFCTARYAEPYLPDYHDRLRSLTRPLTAFLRRAAPRAKSRVCVDSAPILERAFANRSGIGAIGKNTSLLVPGHGSYVFLAEILTAIPMFIPEQPRLKDPCGRCTRCLEACPTGALEAPYRLNAGKCLSYLTIESSKPLSRGTANRMGQCFLGCDACQEVCPHNAPVLSPEATLPPAKSLLDMDSKAFEARFSATALARPGRRKIQRNLKLLLELKRLLA
jgi:epoxyqueuosine reductase